MEKLYAYLFWLLKNPFKKTKLLSLCMEGVTCTRQGWFVVFITLVCLSKELGSLQPVWSH